MDVVQPDRKLVLLHVIDHAGASNVVKGLLGVGKKREMDQHRDDLSQKHSSVILSLETLLV